MRAVVAGGRDFCERTTSVADKVAGLKLADDYICKPFGPRELVARYMQGCDAVRDNS
jgi:hypothetical protein